MKIYILTREHNQYDQYGEYFVKAFKDKPSIGNIADAIGGGQPNVDSYMSAVALCDHILKGGGRQKTEDIWYNLEQVDI